MVALVGPTGAGKTSLLKAVKVDLDVISPISSTTRLPRSGEAHGEDYNYISTDEFRYGISQGSFLEYAVVHGSLYGTPRAELERVRRSGKIVCWDLDVQGARQIREKAPEVTLVFIFASLEELRRRLEKDGNRGNPEARLKNAVLEMRQVEIADYVLRNDNFDKTLGNFKELLQTLNTGYRPDLMRFSNSLLRRQCLKASL